MYVEEGARGRFGEGNCVRTVAYLLTREALEYSDMRRLPCEYREKARSVSCLDFVCRRDCCVPHPLEFVCAPLGRSLVYTYLRLI